MLGLLGTGRRALGATNGRGSLPPRMRGGTPKAHELHHILDRQPVEHELGFPKFAPLLQVTPQSISSVHEGGCAGRE
jgi:hypothetical protein